MSITITPVQVFRSLRHQFYSKYLQLWPKTDPEKVVSLKTFERSSKMFPRYFLFFMFSLRTLSVRGSGWRGGAISPGRTVLLHLKYTSQRPCWFLVILCCMIYMICHFWMLCFFVSGGRSICTVLCYKWEIQAKWGFMIWNIWGDESF